MIKPRRSSSVIKAELEAFRATLPPKDLKLPDADSAVAQQMQAWHTCLRHPLGAHKGKHEPTM